MKRFLPKLTAAATFAAMMLAAVSCKEDDPVAVQPSVSLEKGVAAATTLSFTLSARDAHEAAYLVIREGGGIVA